MSVWPLHSADSAVPSYNLVLLVKNYAYKQGQRQFRRNVLKVYYTVT